MEQLQRSGSGHYSDTVHQETAEVDAKYADALVTLPASGAASVVEVAVGWIWAWFFAVRE